MTDRDTRDGTDDSDWAENKCRRIRVMRSRMTASIGLTTVVNVFDESKV